MRHRRAAAVALGLGIAAAAVVPAVRHVLASAPSNAFLPDFSSTVPGPQTEDSGWALQVSTGGVEGGQHVTLSFLYNGKPGDRAHAVTFNQLDPGEIASNQDITVLTLPGPPAGVPAQPIAQGCNIGQRGSDVKPHAVTVDPYAQTISITMQGHEDAGTILFFCFSGNHLVGFPSNPGPGYSIRYTESGNGSTDVAYTVQPQSQSQTTTAQILGDDGSDQTNAGLGGSRPAVLGTSYPINVVGATPGGIFFLTAEVYDASSQIVDSAAKVTVKERGQGCALPQDGQLCDPGTGVATGTITVTSPSGRLDYVAITVQPTVGSSVATNPTQKINSLVSLTVGPPNAPPPAPQATPTPQPSGSTGGPAAFDGDCPPIHVAPAHGVGSHDVLDALGHVLIPDADGLCPDLSSKLNYVGANDELGLQKTMDCGSEYAFAGIDRVLTTQEESNYSATGCLGGGMQQFPVLIEPVVVTYNLDAPGCAVSRVNLRSQVLSAIFTGAITNWGDPKLVNPDNLGLQNCHLPILVAHDLGPATLTFKDYLSKRTGLWNAYTQPQLVNAWPNLAPVSCTANGSEAMALCVEGQPGMIGYGFYRAIAGAGLPVAAVDDPTTTFQASPLDPSTGCEAAAASNPLVPTTMDSNNWAKAPSITDTPLAYPICSFDFVIVANHCSRPVASYSGLKAFLGAVYTEKAQEDLVAAGFARLPANVMTNAKAGFESQATSSLQC